MKIRSINNYCIKKKQSFGNINLNDQYGRTIDGAGNRSYTDIEKGLMRIEERQMKNEDIQARIINQNNHILRALHTLAKVHDDHTNKDSYEELTNINKMKEICKKGQV